MWIRDHSGRCADTQHTTALGLGERSLQSEITCMCPSAGGIRDGEQSPASMTDSVVMFYWYLLFSGSS